MIWDEFLRHFASVMRKIAGYLTKNRSEKDQKIAQGTHEKRIHQAKKNFLEKFKTASKFIRLKYNENEQTQGL